MADIFQYIGVLAFVIGIALVFAPSILKKVNDLSSKSVTKIDAITFKYRIWFGVSLLVISAFMILYGIKGS